MTPGDLALITGELGPLIKAYVEQKTAALEAHNKALELRVLELETRPEPVKPERGERGELGPKGDTGISVASLLLNAENRLIVHYNDGRVQDMGPAPIGPPGMAGKDGAPGRDGIDGKDGAAGLDGKDGAAGIDGKDGAPGIDGKDGAPGLNGKDGAAGMAGKDGAPGYSGKDGAAGLDGKDGAPGLNGNDGTPGINGKDGVGVMDAVLDRTGHLILTLSDGRTKEVGIVVGRDGLDGKDGIGTEGAPGRDGRDVDMDAVKALVLSELHTWPRPKDGKDGRDGSWDAVKVDYDKDRTVRLLFKDGTPVEGGVLVFPATIDRGVYEPGKAYARGDGLTHDGHWWVAQADTTETPGDGAKSWRLAVRRGKQGKEGKPGKDAPVLRTTNTPRLYE